MSNLKAAAHGALEVLGVYAWKAQHRRTADDDRAAEAAVTALEAALAEPVQEPLTRQQAGLRRGDILRCVESGVLCTVWATSTSGKALVKWGSDDFGSYTAEQIGELFWVEPRVQEPVAWLDQDINCAYTAAEMDGDSTNGLVPLYTAPPQRPLLTDEEIDALALEGRCDPAALRSVIDCIIRGEKE